jgi:flagellar motor component MotA
MDFDIEYRNLIGRIMTAMNTAKRKGLFACGSLIDKEGLRRREVFDVGLSLVCMGCDGEDIKTVLENIESHASNPQWKLLDKVALHGILGIQHGESTGYMSLLLDSLIPPDERLGNVVEEVTEYLS